MVISLFVLLAWITVLDFAVNIMTSTIRITSFKTPRSTLPLPAQALLLRETGSDERELKLPCTAGVGKVIVPSMNVQIATSFRLSTQCHVHLVLKDIPCPRDTKCGSSSHTYFEVFCPSNTFSSGSATRFPWSTFEYSAKSGGECCLVNIRYETSLCLEHHREILAVILVFKSRQTPSPQTNEDKASVVVDSLSHFPLQEMTIVGGQDKPTGTRILAKHKAWRPSIGRIALPSQVAEQWRIQLELHEIHRLGSAVLSLLVVTVVMLVL